MVKSQVSYRHRMRTRLFLILLFLAGFLFRLWVIHRYPQQMIFDQNEYEIYASRIFSTPSMLASYTFRPYPYPLFLALLYKFVGFGNHDAIRVIQAAMDSIVGVLLYWVLKKIRLSRSVPWLACVLYELNPFTTAYVGAILSENVAIFCLGLSFFFGVQFVEKPRKLTGFLFGLSVLMLAEARLAALVWTVLMVLVTLVILPIRKYFVSYASLLLGAGLVLSYPLYVNWRDFHQVSVTTVDNFYAKELYLGAVMDRLGLAFEYEPDVQIMYREYYTEYNPHRTVKDRQDIANKYLGKTWDIIRTDPKKYILQRIQKLLYLWHTDTIFPYNEPGYEQHKYITYYLNFLLLVLSLIGMLIFGVSRKGLSARWFWLASISTLAYVTISHSFTIAEHRFVIPFYPLIIGFASIGLVSIAGRVRRIVA